MDPKRRGRDRCVKIGVPGVDDLLYDSVPAGKQILAVGPPWIGIGAFLNQFMWAGMANGETVVMLTTEDEPSHVRKELRPVVRNLEKFEEHHLINYIDAVPGPIRFSSETAPNTEMVDGPEDLDGIERAIDGFRERSMAGSGHMRLAVGSLTMLLLAFTDPAKVLTRLQRITGSLKKDGVTAIYRFEEGLSDKRTIAAVCHLMDGTVRFKEKGDRTYLRVEGICDARSRRWKEYVLTKGKLEMK